MSGSLIERNKSESKKKGTYAAVAWGGTVLLGISAGAFLAVPAAVGAGYLTYKWFMFRAKRGMRF